MPDHEQQFEPFDARQFLASLRKSGLVVAEKLDRFLAADRSSSNNKTAESNIAERMIDAGLITRWQSTKLARGINQGYFLGKYRLLDHLGSGGMSTVYLAEHSLSGQKRAIKVLPREKMTERSYLTRFYLEGRAVAALNHPNIVRIYDIGEDTDRHYMVMEFLEGSDLFDTVATHGPLEFDLAADCIVQAARGLAHAHDRNLIHRDIKPANLFRTGEGVLKVLDLGLALFKSDDDPQLSQQHNEWTMGTADFLSPEQALDSHGVDARADIYSLGCTLFYLLTGRAPFNTGSLAQRIAQHQSKQPPRIRELRRDCPEYLATICDRMMHKNPAERFPNCGEVIATLESQSRLPSGAGVQSTDQPAMRSAIATRSVTQMERRIKSIGATARRGVPIGIWVGLGTLALVPIFLTVFVFHQSTRRQTGQMENNGSPISLEQSNNAHEAPSATPLNAKFDSNLSGMEESKFPVLKPKATPLRLFLDFEAPARFSAKRDSWRLFENGVFVGTLLTRKKCRIGNSPRGQEPGAGSFSLWIDGASDQVEFRPDNRDSQLESISFLACRATTDEVETPFLFHMDAKSHRQFERWETVYSSGRELDDQSFMEVVLGPEQFQALDARKFRFRTGGTDKDRLIIDNLTITLSPE